MRRRLRLTAEILIAFACKRGIAAGSATALASSRYQGSVLGPSLL
jgi:hypothetical protein